MIKPRKTVSLDLKTYTTLRKIAFNKGISITELVRDLIQRYIQGGVIKKNLTN